MNIFDLRKTKAMKEREVQDQGNIIWKCVQAFSGTNGEAAQEASRRIEEENSSVPVICTPSGGETTVRLSLTKGWEEDLSDEDLIKALNQNRNK